MEVIVCSLSSIMTSVYCVGRIISEIMSSLRTTCTFLLRSTRLMTSQQANLSRSALVYSDMQLKDKLKEPKKLEVHHNYTAPTLSIIIS